MGCGASSANTQPPPSPGAPQPKPAAVVDDKVRENLVEKFIVSAPNSPDDQNLPKADAVVAFPSPPAAEESPPNPGVAIPGAVPDSVSPVDDFQAVKPAPPPGSQTAPRPSRPDSARSTTSARSRGEGAQPRPVSAERKRKTTELKDKSRPGSAGRNRDEKALPNSVWLTDRRPKNIGLIEAESKLDKDIFSKGSPKKTRYTPKSEKRRARTPPRPTTAKRRDNRPSSAERQRGGGDISEMKLQNSVWLDGISRDKTAGTRNFIDCTAKSNKAEVSRPSSAERNRKHAKSEKKKKKEKSRIDTRPSSAERSRLDEQVNSRIWLEGHMSNKDKVNGEGNKAARPGSAGQKRAGIKTDNNGKILDQNGRPSSAEKIRALSPLRGSLAPLKSTPSVAAGVAAEV